MLPVSLGKKLFSFLVMYGLIFSIILAGAQAFSEPPQPPEPSPPLTIVYVYPEELTVEVGEVFNVYINVRDVSGLQGFDFMLLYNTAFLDCVALEEGTFLSDVNHTFVAMREIDDAYNETCGRVWFAVAIFGDGFADGNGTLAIISFEATDEGESVLDLYSDYPYREDEVKLVTCGPEPIENKALDGYVVIDPHPPPTDPLVGDVNGDGVVDMEDIDMIAGAYGAEEGDNPRYSLVLDLDKNGVIDLCDLLIAAQEFGRTV